MCSMYGSKHGLVHMVSCRDDRHHHNRRHSCSIGRVTSERLVILAEHTQKGLQQRGSVLKVCFAVKPPNADLVLRVLG